MKDLEIKHLPSGTTSCGKKTCKSAPYEWEQIHGMRMVRSVDGTDVYFVRCPKCGNHETILKN
jgi:hypothetical protein